MTVSTRTMNRAQQSRNKAARARLHAPPQQQPRPPASSPSTPPAPLPPASSFPPPPPLSEVFQQPEQQAGPAATGFRFGGATPAANAPLPYSRAFNGYPSAFQFDDNFAGAKLFSQAPATPHPEIKAHEAAIFSPAMAPPRPNDVDVEKMRDEISSLVQKLEDSNKRVTRLNEEVASLKERNDTLTQENASQYDENLEHQGSLDQEKARYDALNDKYNALVQSNAGTVYERDQLIQAHTESNAKREATEASVLKTKDNMITSLKRDLIASQDQLKSTQSDFKRVNRLQEDRGRLIVELEHKAKDRQDEIDRIMKETDALQEERNRLLDLRKVIEDYFEVADLSPDALRDVFDKVVNDRQGPVQSLDPRKPRAVSVEAELSDGQTRTVSPDAESPDGQNATISPEAESSDEQNTAISSETKSPDGQNATTSNEAKLQDDQAPTVSETAELPDGRGPDNEKYRSTGDNAQALDWIKLISSLPEGQQQEIMSTIKDNSHADAASTPILQDPVPTTAPGSAMEPKPVPLSMTNTLVILATMSLMAFLMSMMSERSKWLAANELTRQNVVCIRDGLSWMGGTDGRFIAKVHFALEQMLGLDTSYRGLLG